MYIYRKPTIVYIANYEYIQKIFTLEFFLFTFVVWYVFFQPIFLFCNRFWSLACARGSPHGRFLKSSIFFKIPIFWNSKYRLIADSINRRFSYLDRFNRVKRFFPKNRPIAVIYIFKSNFVYLASIVFLATVSLRLIQMLLNT